MNWFRKYYSFSIVLILQIIACKSGQKPLSEEEFNSTRNKMVEVNKILVRKDHQLIKAYSGRYELDMTETQTGLWYKIEKKGAGTPVAPGKEITIHYKVSLLDGTICYSSDFTGPKKFVSGKGNVESGLEEGILLMNAGGQAKFILPPHLAHGLPGDGNKIPARAIIIYDVEVISVD